jgi:hypothetical protein
MTIIITAVGLGVWNSVWREMMYASTNFVWTTFHRPVLEVKKKATLQMFKIT